jgi:hypothetical protein
MIATDVLDDQTEVAQNDARIDLVVKDFILMKKQNMYW